MSMRRSWERKAAQLASQTLPPDSVVMLGDSITEFADWPTLLPGATVHNHGIGGDDTLGVLRRLHLVTDAKPAQVFLMIGTNDLGKGDLPVSTIVENLGEIVDRIQAESPTTQIYVQSVLPRWHTRRCAVQQLNAGIEAIAHDRGVEWVELRPLFDQGDGTMDLAFAPDALHPNLDGYQRWARAIEPLVRVGERALRSTH